MLTVRFTGVKGKIVKETHEEEIEPLTAGMVGRQVLLEFSPEWEGLSKTVVFTAGSVTRDAIYTGGPVTIPAEVLEKPLVPLWIGVYGVSADGKVVIPTVRKEISVIQPGADPSGDPGTEPDLAIWAQLQTQLDNSDRQIAVLTDNISGISVFARFVSSEGYALSIDTKAMTVRIPDGYVFLKRPRMGQARLTVADTTCAINTESVFSFVVVDVITKEISSIKYDDFDATAQVVLAVLWNGHYTDPAANWIRGPYLVDGKRYNDPAQCSASDEIAELQKNISGISVFARFVSSEGYALSIDTKAMTVRIPAGYVFLKRPRMGQARLTVADTTCAINTESVFSFVVVDVITKEISSIKYDDFDATAQVVLAVLWNGHYTDPAANWIPGPYLVNGFLYNAPTEQPVYVATTGNDYSGIGDRNNPFRTIQKAVESGAKTIFVFPGTYRESISASRVGGEIEILAKPTSNTNKDVVLDLGTELNLAEDADTGLVKAAYASTSDDFLYKAFVSQTETLFYADSFAIDGYSCNLWRGNTKLTPVLTLAECQATSGTWFYDGANIYANAEPGTYTLADGSAEYGIHLSYFKKVKLMGIDVRYAKRDGVRLDGCTDAEISRCRFGYSGLYTGLALNSTSAVVRNCEAMYNRTDGFNIHGVGTADFIDCVSHDNWDDGISHHDQSGGMILGGEYCRNGKGGVCSPTFGSRNSVGGVYIHDNREGVYAVTDSDGEYPRCTVSNCTIVNNAKGVRTSRYELLGWNNHISGNGQDVVEENGGTWTALGGNADQGADGYTPVKGVDYYTDADKAEMIDAVIAALPVYAGEVE